MKSLVLAIGVFCASAFGAASTQADSLLGDLSRCDSTFFVTLAQRSGDYASNPYYRVSGSHGYFAVVDRSQPKRSIRKFDPGLRVGHLEAVAYFDEVFDLGDEGVFVSWGFLIKAPLREVVEATESLVWERERLRKDQDVFVRSEVWTHSNKEQGWERINTVGGRVPKPGIVERVLLIEPFEDDLSLTRFGCSLQGSVTRDMLRSERPDLGIK